MEKEKEDLWEGVYCPDYFRDQIEFYPDPNITVFIQSIDGRQLLLDFGFCTDESRDWWFPMKLKDLLAYSCGNDWRIGESWGFRV